MVGFVPPDLWAAVEVEPDEQRLDLEGVELGLRAPWEAVATQLERHPHSHLHVEVVPKLCEEQVASEDILHAAANSIAIAIDGGCGKGSGMGDSG